MQRVGGGSALVGGLVALASVMAITVVVYGLREIMPAVSTGVVYLLAVLLVSTYWGLWLGARDCGGECRRLQFLSHSAY